MAPTTRVGREVLDETAQAIFREYFAKEIVKAAGDKSNPLHAITKMVMGAFKLPPFSSIGHEGRTGVLTALATYLRTSPRGMDKKWSLVAGSAIEALSEAEPELAKKALEGDDKASTTFAARLEETLRFFSDIYGTRSSKEVVNVLGALKHFDDQFKARQIITLHGLLRKEGTIGTDLHIGLAEEGANTLREALEDALVHYPKDLEANTRSAAEGLPDLRRLVRDAKAKKVKLNVADVLAPEIDAIFMAWQAKFPDRFASAKDAVDKAVNKDGPVARFMKDFKSKISFDAAFKAFQAALGVVALAPGVLTLAGFVLILSVVFGVIGWLAPIVTIAVPAVFIAGMLVFATLFMLAKEPGAAIMPVLMVIASFLGLAYIGLPIAVGYSGGAMLEGLWTGGVSWTWLGVFIIVVPLLELSLRLADEPALMRRALNVTRVFTNGQATTVVTEVSKSTYRFSKIGQSIAIGSLLLASICYWNAYWVNTAPRFGTAATGIALGAMIGWYIYTRASLIVNWNGIEPKMHGTVEKVGRSTLKWLGFGYGGLLILSGVLAVLIVPDPVNGKQFTLEQVVDAPSNFDVDATGEIIKECSARDERLIRDYFRDELYVRGCIDARSWCRTTKENRPECADLVDELDASYFARHVAAGISNR